MVAWTNSRFDQNTRALATQHGVQIAENRELAPLLKKFAPTKMDLIKGEATRAKSIDEIKARLRLA